MKHNWIAIVAVAIACLVGFSGVAAETKKPPMAEVSKKSVSSRHDNLHRLVNTSSGAERIQASGNAGAEQKRQQAVALVDEAEALLKKGDAAAANGKLDEATKLMFAAIREAGMGAAGTAKKKSDFDNKAESVDAMIEALERIAKEKQVEQKVAPVVAEIQANYAKAKQLEDAGQYDQARAQLDATYTKATTTVESLRRGDTLVRSLNFASKEEEYHYELDRNDTHQMLLNVLAKEKMEASASLKTMVNKYKDKAMSLRGQAESEASSGAYEKAVKSLEASTKELVRAIRSAGIYIPG